jgi:signal transduction histidine kinase
MSTLLQKNTRYLLTWLPVVLTVCCIIFYMVMRWQARHMQEKQLQLKQSNIWSVFLKNNGNIERYVPGEYDIQKGTLRQEVKGSPRDTSVWLPQQGKQLPFEVLSKEFIWNDDVYTVSAYVSSTEISHLIIKVFVTEALILALLMLSILVLNTRSSRILWKPFFSTLKLVNDYDITRNQSFELPAETGTAEFNELNKVLNDLVNKGKSVYYNQKQFVENASHEMQTPLAIIRSKLELLMNQPQLTQKVASQLAEISDANQRLSRMNRTLLLLAKIENHQFPDIQEVEFSSILNETIISLRIHYDNDFPNLKVHIFEGVKLKANPSLLEILAYNLVNNAVEHNVPGGTIMIVLTPESLLIENTGLPLTQKTEELFERFKKGSHKSKSTGLGLALVRQICNLYNYSVTYTHCDGLHTIEVVF